jgi:peroxiredoxin
VIKMRMFLVLLWAILGIASAGSAASRAVLELVEDPALKEHLSSKGIATEGRVEAFVEAGLLHARRTDANGLVWHIILGHCDESTEPQLLHRGDLVVEVRHPNGHYFVRDMWAIGGLTAYRERLTENTTAPLDETLLQGAIDLTEISGGVHGVAPVSISKWEKDEWLWLTTGPAPRRWSVHLRLSPTIWVPERPDINVLPVATFSWDRASFTDTGELLYARYKTRAHEEKRLKALPLVEGAVPFNIVASEWLTPISLDGGYKKERLGWLKGRPILLYFWAHWQQDSVAGLQHLRSLADAYAERGLTVIGIHSAEGGQSARAFADSLKLDFALAVDTGATAERYEVWSYPQAVLIDRHMKIAWLGAADKLPQSEQIDALLTSNGERSLP